MYANRPEIETQGSVVWSNALPTTGQWYIGDLVWNMLPTARGRSEPGHRLGLRLGWFVGDVTFGVISS